MCKYIIAAILLCDTVGVMSAANACSPPIANCSCVDGTLSCMHLTELPADIPSNITEFMFEECRLGQLTHIPYTKAEVLFIRNSGLTDISDGVLQNLVSLKTLDLTGNRLVSLRKEMFLGLRSLTDLSLRYTGIKHVADDAFENLPNLIEINLSENSGLHISDNVLSKNKELKHIMLRRCDLKNIPTNALSKAQALTTLELEHNPLGSIPTNTFTKLNKLQKLNLFGCSLTAIPVGTFNGLKSLVTLNLGENNITEIPDSVFDDSRTTLQNLYLNDNKLKSLTGGESGDDIISWQNLHELKLGGNPWTCDCNLKWMRALDKSRIDDGKIICAEPESMMGRHVTLVMENEDSVSCPSEGGSSAIALGIAIPIIIICLLLIAFFIYKIMQTRRQRAGKKSVRYSEVYKDTVETTPKEGTQPLSVL